MVGDFLGLFTNIGKCFGILEVSEISIKLMLSQEYQEKFIVFWLSAVLPRFFPETILSAMPETS